MKKVITVCAILLSFVLEAQQSGEFIDKRDGKTYKTTVIGTQTWMAENLNVSKFRNGDPILEAKTPEEWSNAARDRKAAWCYFGNDPKNGEKFGKLYNFFAVSDPRGLAPEGWNVPSNDEFSEMINDCGTMTDAFIKLKAGEDWGDKKGTNSLGFKALPGGMRLDANQHNFIYQYGLFWTATEQDQNTAFYRYYGWPDNEISLQANSKQHGFSVRCVKKYRFSESILQIKNTKKLSNKDQNTLLTKVLDSLYITVQKERVFNNQKNNELNNQIAALDDKARKMGERLNSKNDKIKEGETKLTDLASENITLQTKVESLSHELKVSQDKLSDVNGQLMAKNQQINSLETQLKTAQDISRNFVDQTNLTQEITNLKRQLQEKTDSLKLLRTTTNKPSINANQNNGTSAAQVTNNTSHTAITSQTGSFKSVKIGAQTWMAENLNVDRFRNGDPIPEAKTAEEWKRAGENKQPVWGDPYTLYESIGNDKKNDFGINKLYNWWAVTDPRGLAPSGWHITTDGEWVQMLNSLGGDDCTACDELDGLGRSKGKKVFVRNVATKLKSEKGWPINGCLTCSGGSEAFKDKCSDCKGTGANSKNPISYNGTNSSGMNVFPAGHVTFYISSGELNYRNYGKNTNSAFWNSSIDKDNYTWVRSFDESGDIYKFELNVSCLDANKYNFIFKVGASVRCVKD